MNNMAADKAAGAMLLMDPAKAASIMEKMDPDKAAAVLEQMNPEEAAGMLGNMDPSKATAVLQNMSPAAAAATLNTMSPSEAGSFIGSMDPAKAREVLVAMDPADAAAILGNGDMSLEKQMELVMEMSVEDFIKILRAMPIHEAVTLLGAILSENKGRFDEVIAAIDEAFRIELYLHMDPPPAARVLQAMEDHAAAWTLLWQHNRSSEVLALVSIAAAAAMMDSQAPELDAVADVLRGVPGGRTKRLLVAMAPINAARVTPLLTTPRGESEVVLDVWSPRHVTSPMQLDRDSFLPGGRIRNF